MKFTEFKEGEKHAAVNPEITDDPDAFQDAGLILSDQDIVIDIDHLPMRSIKAMIRDFKITTFTVWTDRGAHLYFRKPSESFRRTAQGVCKLGFTIEQHNKTSRPNGMTIKRNGQLRSWENEDIRQILPDIFTIPKGKNKLEDLTGMGEGEGRNQKLFQHRVKIGNVKNYAVICNFINNYVFEVPLPVTEMETILRDDIDIDKGADEEFFVSDELIHRYRMISALGAIWWLEDNEYVTGIEKLRRLVYEHCEGKKTYFVDEVIRQIEYRVKIADDSHGFPIRLKNGYITEGKFILSHKCTDFTPYCIDVEYDENAQPVEIVDDYIDQLTDHDSNYRKLLMEALGYVMITDPEKVRMFAKFFMFRGDGANGKGTLLQIMKRIYGENNCTALSLKQLQDKTYNITLIGKLANLGDDVEPTAINDEQLKIIKNITTADTIALRHLYKESFNATVTAKLYFTSNNDLKSYEKGYAYERRVIWLPMFIKVQKPDPKFICKMTTPEALKYWIRLIVEGYIRLYENSAWTESEKVKEFNLTYHKENNPTKEFAESLDDSEILGKSINEIEQAFNDWSGDVATKFSKKEFKAAVFVRNLVSKPSWVNGKTRRVFCKDDKKVSKTREF